MLVRRLLGQLTGFGLIQHPRTADRVQRRAFRVLGQIDAAIEQFHDKAVLYFWLWRRCGLLLDALRRPAAARFARIGLAFVFGHIGDVL